jgi:hypothetical protein
MANRERALSGEARDRAGSGARARSGSVIGRIVLVAVDASDNAKTAFNCELRISYHPVSKFSFVFTEKKPKLLSLKVYSNLSKNQ